MLVYDVTKRKSFDNCANWIEDMQLNGCDTAKLLVLGNKIDLVQMDPSMRAVADKEGERLAYSHDGIFEEVSAVTHQNVSEAFVHLLDKIYRENNRATVRNGNLDTSGLPIEKNTMLDKKDEEKDWCC